MDQLDRILKKRRLSKDDIVVLLSLTDEGEVERLRRAAYDTTTRRLGNQVFLRGIVEFSNICTQNCFYCGIRKDNAELHRYCLSPQEILDSALWSASAGYGSCVLQSGERRDSRFVTFVEESVQAIRSRSRSECLPQGLGITLSLGEQPLETYRRVFAAGAHRYLLRIETSNPRLFADLHPANQRFDDRLSCLDALRQVGFQVGTGVMIGIPGQTVEDLADDILFFARQDIDMIGMGPYLVHRQSPMQERGMMENRSLLQLSLKMIAVTRLVLKDANIAATTALQALVPDGRERGIEYGANVVMPNLTPTEVRKSYQLYEGKPCLNEGREECRTCLQIRIESVGRIVGWNEWGDSRHFSKRMLRKNERE